MPLFFRHHFEVTYQLIVLQAILLDDLRGNLKVAKVVIEFLPDLLGLLEESLPLSVSFTLSLGPGFHFKAQFMVLGPADFGVKSTGEDLTALEVLAELGVNVLQFHSCLQNGVEFKLLLILLRDRLSAVEGPVLREGRQTATFATTLVHTIGV